MTVVFASSLTSQAEEVAAPDSASAGATGEARTDRQREPDAVPPMREGTGRVRPGGRRTVERSIGGEQTWVVLLRMCYPPNPPPLGVEVMARGGNAPPMPVPSPLKLFVMDPFYAPLSTRLIEQDLPDDLRERVNDYRRARVAELSALRDVLYGLEGADASARFSELRAFSRRQTPRLVETEREAQALRREMIEVRAYGAPGDWGYRREWRLGRGALKKPRDEIAYYEYQVMRAAVFYLEGISPEQRRLIQEMAMDLEDKIFRSDSAPVREFGFLFFSPHTARLRLPDETPADLVERVQAYVAEKTKLKEELRELIYDLEGYLFASSREKTCREMAEKQEPRLAALEDLADSIRAELVFVPGWERREMPQPLPDDLDFLIGKFLREKDQLRRDYTDRIRRIRDEFPPPPPGAEEAEKTEWEQKVVRAAEEVTTKFRVESTGRLRDLQDQLEVLRAAIERFTAGELEMPYGNTVDAFLTEFVANRRIDESAFDYQTAVLEPGLSAEQRRLLFAAAIERMNLPLPGAESQAFKLPGTLLK